MFMPKRRLLMIVIVILLASSTTAYLLTTEGVVNSSDDQPMMILDHPAPIHELEFTDDNDLQVTLKYADQIQDIAYHQHHWQLQSDTRTFHLLESTRITPPTSINRMSISGDEQWLASIQDQVVQIYKSAEDDPIATLDFRDKQTCAFLQPVSTCPYDDPTHYIDPVSVEFLPDNRLLISGGLFNRTSPPHLTSVMMLWDWEQGEIVEWQIVPMAYPILSYDIQTDLLKVQGTHRGDSCGRGLRGILQVWDVDPFRQLDMNAEQEYFAGSSDLSPSGQHMVLGAKQSPCINQPDFGVYVWSPATSAVERLTTDSVVDVVWHPTSDDHFATLSSSTTHHQADTVYTIMIWQIDPQSQDITPWATPIEVRDIQLESIAYSSNDFLAVGSSEGIVYVWDVHNLQ